MADRKPEVSHSPAPQGADPWAQIHATYYALMLYGNTGEASQRRVYLAADVDQARQQMQEEIDRLRAERDELVESDRFLQDQLVKLEDLVARLTAERAAHQEQVVQIEALIEKQLSTFDAVCYGVDVHKKFDTEQPVIDTVVRRSDAMHALLFVRQAVEELAALLAAEGPPES